MYPPAFVIEEIEYMAFPHHFCLKLPITLKPALVVSYHIYEEYYYNN